KRTVPFHVGARRARFRFEPDVDGAARLVTKLSVGSDAGAALGNLDAGGRRAARRAERAGRGAAGARGSARIRRSTGARGRAAAVARSGAAGARGGAAARARRGFTAGAGS